MPDLLFPLTIDYWCSPSYAGFTCGNSLLSGFCSSQPMLCRQLPSDSSSRWTPLPRLVVPTDTAHSGLAPPKNTPCLAHVTGPHCCDPVTYQITKPTMFGIQKISAQKGSCGRSSTEPLVSEKIKEERSPEQICGYAKLHSLFNLSHEWIYQFILENKKRGGKLHKHLRLQHKKYRKRYGSPKRQDSIKNRR